MSGDLIGGLFNSVFMPLAATSGLLTTAGLIEHLVVAQAALGVVGRTLPV